MRYDFYAEQRERATVLPNGLKVLTDVDSFGRPTATVWLPKAIKPLWSYYFKSVESMAKRIAETVAGYDEQQARKASYRAARAAGDPSQVKIGDVFSYSWGYDQTNVEYYQVTERSGKMVTLCEIGQEVEPNSEGFMSERVRPAIGKFLLQCKVCRCSEWSDSHNEHVARARNIEFHEYQPERISIRKKIQFYGGEPSMSMEHGCLSPVKVIKFADGTPPLAVGAQYQSHYA